MREKYKKIIVAIFIFALICIGITGSYSYFREADLCKNPIKEQVQEFCEGKTYDLSFVSFGNWRFTCKKIEIQDRFKKIKTITYDFEYECNPPNWWIIVKETS